MCQPDGASSHPVGTHVHVYEETVRRPAFKNAIFKFEFWAWFGLGGQSPLKDILKFQGQISQTQNAILEIAFFYAGVFLVFYSLVSSMKEHTRSYLASLATVKTSTCVGNHSKDVDWEC